MPEADNVVSTETESAKEETKPTEAVGPSAPPQSPAADLRTVQMLLVQGIFPGSAAPMIIQGYQLLEKMAKKIEDEAGFKS